MLSYQVVIKFIKIEVIGQPMAIALKMASKNFLPRCTVFFIQIPIESLKVCNSNSMHLGKKILTAIFSAILNSQLWVQNIVHQNQ